MNAAQHLELYLGPMERGWSSESLRGVQICLFRNQPMSGVVTLATLGLSKVAIPMTESRQVRQELLCAVDETETETLEDHAKLLLHVSEQILNSKRALLRGDVVPLESSITKKSSANAFYASIPSIYPEDLATLKASAPSTVFVWLIPVLPSEVFFIRNSGWEAFENRLEAQDPDLWDLSRSAVA